MEKKQELDPLDYKILEILVHDANLPYTEIGQRLMYLVVQYMFE